MELSKLYVLRKTGTKIDLYLTRNKTVKTSTAAKTFNHPNKAIDFMLEKKLLDDYDLITVEDLYKILME
jgi:hypothetical protein